MPSDFCSLLIVSILELIDHKNNFRAWQSHFAEVFSIEAIALFSASLLYPILFMTTALLSFLLQFMFISIFLFTLDFNLLKSMGHFEKIFMVFSEIILLQTDAELVGNDLCSGQR